MAKTATKEAIAEKIDLLDQWEGKAERKGFKPMFVIIPTAVLTVVTGTFFVVRRFRNKNWK